MAIGINSLRWNIIGNYNTANGFNSLLNNLGSNNTASGSGALTTNTTGSNNTAIGYNADVASNNLTNATAIGNGAIVTASNAIQLGNASVTNVKTSGTITAGTVTYPNTDGTSGQVLSTTGSGTLTWTTSSNVTHSIGESYQGGIIFWVDASGQHGLITSISDQSTGIRWYADPAFNVNTMAYGGKNNANFGGIMGGISTSGGVGGGKTNTILIISLQGFGDGNNYAARLCNEYSVTSGGVTYEDWYLPSIDELNLMDLNVGRRSSLSNIANFTTGVYWSSSEVSSSNAISQHLNGGMQRSQSKSTLNSVRAIRAF
jgi:hypothetical protein